MVGGGGRGTVVRQSQAGKWTVRNCQLLLSYCRFIATKIEVLLHVLKEVKFLLKKVDGKIYFAVKLVIGRPPVDTAVLSRCYLIARWQQLVLKENMNHVTGQGHCPLGKWICENGFCKTLTSRLVCDVMRHSFLLLVEGFLRQHESGDSVSPLPRSRSIDNNFKYL